ncbi:hypothetical protein ACFQ1S_42715, partial [Kibdelosporangium lantanae]
MAVGGTADRLKFGPQVTATSLAVPYRPVADSGLPGGGFVPFSHSQGTVGARRARRQVPKMFQTDWSDSWRGAFRIELRAEAVGLAWRGWPVLPGTYP